MFKFNIIYWQEQGFKGEAKQWDSALDYVVGFAGVWGQDRGRSLSKAKACQLL